MAEDKKAETQPKAKKPAPKITKFEVVSDDPLRFNLGETEYDLIKGDKIELPEENPYIAGLFAQGYLVRAKSI